jgi:hypothetical protein
MVVSAWPGLTDNDLDRGELQVTTDYRQVLIEMLRSRTASPSIAQAFPGYRYPGNLGLFLRQTRWR